MIQAVIPRRQVLISGLSVSALVAAPQSAWSASAGHGQIQGGFAHSRTICDFVAAVVNMQLPIPAAEREALCASLVRTDVEPISAAEERAAARSFVCVTMWLILPFLLRRTGLEAFAATCERERDFCRPGFAARGLDLIDFNYSGRQAAGCAFSLRFSARAASDAAEKCRLLANHPEMDQVAEAGSECATALSCAGIGGVDPGETIAESEEEAWMWDVAKRAIALAAAAARGAPLTFTSVVGRSAG